ncbi:MAG TPA: CHASE3 domain-containing protein [Ohtaekwangia sp.]
MRIYFAYTAFIVSLSVLVILSFIYNRQFKEWSRYNDAIDHTQTVVSNLDNLFSYLKDTETSSRGFLLSTDSSFLEPYNLAYDSIIVISKRLPLLIRDNHSQQKRMDELHTLIEKRLQILAFTNQIYPQDKATFRKSLKRGRIVMDSCRALVKEMKKTEMHLLGERRKMKNSYELAAPNVFVIIFSFTIGAFIISFILLLTEFRNRLRYQKQLEDTVVDLDQFNDDLSQITHISSHHLQEPLRKLSIFSDQLILRHTRHLNDETKLIVHKIAGAALRIRELVEDLSKYTALSRDSSPAKRINLNVVLEEIRNENFSQELKAENLVIEDEITINGHPNQIRLLFRSLIHNSIKFARPDVEPVVHISTARITKSELIDLRKKTGRDFFVKIILKDNGVGFDTSFAKKMFNIFQKLHPEYEGKGIGLAIVKRIMNNHNGFIEAKGEINSGAEFNLYFPS